jgi:hypothetical protein
VQRIFRALGLAAILSLAVPAIASAAPTEDLGNEKVTEAMFILIIVIIALLAIAVGFEQRGGKGH